MVDYHKWDDYHLSQGFIRGPRNKYEIIDNVSISIFLLRFGSHET